MDELKEKTKQSAKNLQRHPKDDKRFQIKSIDTDLKRSSNEKSRSTTFTIKSTSYERKLYRNNQQKTLNKEELIKEIDRKFDMLYEQVALMASDQANFNIKIQNDQNKMKEPLEIEISKIKQESDIMMRELERTQQANRNLMNSVIISPIEPTAKNTKHNT